MPDVFLFLKVNFSLRLLTSDIDMKTHSLVVLTVVAFLGLLAGTAPAQTGNGFANGGFEIQGSTTPAESWIGAADGYTLSTDAFEGDFSLQLQSPTTNAAVAIQNSSTDGGLPPLLQGDTPVFSFYAKGFAGTTGNALFQLLFLDENGVTLYSSGLQFFHEDINPDSFTLIEFTPAPVPEGATSAFVEISQAIGPIDDVNLGGTVLIDNVSLAVNGLVEDFIGDVNSDGAVNFLDIAPFIDVLANGEFLAEADIDLNGEVNFFDIAPFIAILSNQ